MAFTLANFENHSGSGNGPKVWTYANTSDAIATMVAADYFLSVTALVGVGDTIYLRGSDGTAWVTVASASASTVTVTANGLEGSETHDFGSLVDAAGETGSVTVTGAALGDFVIMSCSVDLQGMTLTGYVSAADTVSYRLQNESGGTLDLASATVRARVFKAAS